MTDDPADLDRLFASLSEKGPPPDPDVHPAPEKLAAYQAGELSPEEDADLQEHLAHCTHCSGLLLDLQRFLDPPPEDLPREGVVDFESAAEWRDLRMKLQDARSRPVAGKVPSLREFSGVQALAAVLILLLGGAVYRIVVLERELARPITDLMPTTIEAKGSTRGVPGEDGAASFRLPHVATFETRSSLPRLSLIFRDKDDGTIRRTFDATENEEGNIEVLLPKRFLAPGVYKVEVQGPEGRALNPPKEFDIRILQ